MTEENLLTIRPSARSNNKSSNDVSNTKGLEVKTLLIPSLTTKDRLNIVATRAPSGPFSIFNLKDDEGEYKITNVRHSLSYEGENWHTTMQCEAV